MEGNIYIIDNQKKLIRQAVYIPKKISDSLQATDNNVSVDDMSINKFDDLSAQFSFFEGDPYQLEISYNDWHQTQCNWIDSESTDEINLKRELHKKKRRIIGLAIKSRNISYYFSISSWNTLKNKTIFDLLNSDEVSSSVNANVLKVNYGINLPEFPVAIYDDKKEVLQVFNPEKLGKLFNIDEKYKNRAKIILAEIKNNNFSINNYSVKIESNTDIKQIEDYVLQNKQLCKKMSRLSDIDLENINIKDFNDIFILYSNDKKEKNYVNHIEPVTIKENQMLLTIENIKTFIDVCSDSVYQKMLTKKIGVEK